MTNPIKNRKILTVIFFFLFLGIILYTLNLQNPIQETTPTPPTPTYTLDNRALIIIFENDQLGDGFSTETTGFNANIYRIVLKQLFDLKSKEVSEKSPKDIINDFGENWAINNFKDSSKGYSKFILITDENTTTKYLFSQLASLTNDGYIIDIILNVHGSNESLTFKDKDLTPDDIIEFGINTSYNIGFVYQGACYGATFNEAWIDIGATVVSGTKGLNSFGIFAPAEFIKKISRGHTYEESVEAGYLHAIDIWGQLSDIEQDKINSSKHIYSGDNNYKIVTEIK